VLITCNICRAKDDVYPLWGETKADFEARKGSPRGDGGGKKVAYLIAHVSGVNIERVDIYPEPMPPNPVLQGDFVVLSEVRATTYEQARREMEQRLRGPKWLWLQRFVRYPF
jgi:hypothetical protein